MAQCGPQTKNKSNICQIFSPLGIPKVLTDPMELSYGSHFQRILMILWDLTSLSLSSLCSELLEMAAESLALTSSFCLLLFSSYVDFRPERVLERSSV